MIEAEASFMTSSFHRLKCSPPNLSLDIDGKVTQPLAFFPICVVAAPGDNQQQDAAGHAHHKQGPQGQGQSEHVGHEATDNTRREGVDRLASQKTGITAPLQGA